MDKPKDKPAAVGQKRLVRRALAAACRAAEKHKLLEAKLAELVEARYGIAPNAVDCDPFIDAVDYGHAEITLEQLDAEMTERGYPPNAPDETREE